MIFFLFFGYMFSNDIRYDLIRVNYKNGNIKYFRDIFKYVPRSVIARDLGTRVRRFNRMIDKMEHLTFSDMSLIATFCKMDEIIIIRLAEKEYLSLKQVTKR